MADIALAPYSIAKPPPYLCQLLGRWNGRNVPDGGYMAEQKHDGWRALHFRGLDGKPGLWTRNGHTIHGVGHILYRLAMIEHQAGEPMFFDGEFQVGGTLAATKAWCQSGWKLGGEAGTLHLFDAMPEREWREGGSETPYIIRRDRLDKLVEQADASPLSWEWRQGTHGKEPDGKAVQLVEWEILDSAEDIQRQAERVWAHGGEGLVLKEIDAPYRRNRGPEWLKLKRKGKR